MRRGREAEPFQENFFLHFKNKAVEDRVREALYRPEGLTAEQERGLFAHATFVEISAWLGSLPLALTALGEFIQYYDSIMNDGIIIPDSQESPLSPLKPRQ